ncbi:ran guanine nucleotide release factor [Carcharodon carcharias]|uniref:ran guanine nucleotide release factor n=1 Tax=Carcharodon carcharias TaxID=13397 RepID=UPI001B7E3757|nr:ran guanine nucleotide release factor [Carcharodon carcharias]XP_041037292.1 ran guanine nucleotide release factor [Carcharodon carcharias]XP_041037293.1 ran guanine nucleotide release factor [Carcharodon carcharias]
MATNGDPSRPLFGGSFSAIIPPHSIDVSEIREIPDNQEVFIHSGTDQSIIIELLEHQIQVPDQEAARYHFADITSCNDATGVEGTEILSVESVSSDQIALQDPSSTWFLSGKQRVAKFNEQARNTVAIHLALFRLPQYSTDILITFNDPTVISPFSSSTGVTSTQAAGTSASTPQLWTLEQFRATVQSFRLLDPAIFS